VCAGTENSLQRSAELRFAELQLSSHQFSSFPFSFHFPFLSISHFCEGPEKKRKSFGLLSMRGADSRVSLLLP
jgi:hypothetical protein